MSEAKIKLILIDFNGVAILGSYKNICKDLAEKYEIDFDTVYHEIYKYHNLAAVREFDEEQIFPAGLKDLGIESEDPQQIWERHVQYSSVRNEPMLAYVQTLRERGYPVVALSKNTPKTFSENRRIAQIEDEFDGIINTYDLGFEKGSKETTEYLMERYEVDMPEQMIFVDDQQKNLDVPSQMGTHTIFYKDFKSTKQAIEEILNQ